MGLNLTRLKPIDNNCENKYKLKMTNNVWQIKIKMTMKINTSQKLIAIVDNASRQRKRKWK